jgi:hypothetical protein
MKPFVYTGLASRVVFGAGSIEQLPAELDRLGAKRALILSTTYAGSEMTTIYGLATASPYPNPAPVTYDAVPALLRDAYEGRRPAP